MKYKIVAIDLDGTLLSDSKEIPDKNKEVLRRLSNSGVEIVVATGRRYFSAKEFISQLDMNLTIMSNNGTIVRNMLDDELVVTRYFDEIDFYNVIKEGRNRNLHAITHVDHYSEGYDVIGELEQYDNRYSRYLHDMFDRFKRIDSLLDYKNPKALAIVYTGELDTLGKFQEELNLKYKDKYNAYLMQNLLNVGPILEIINSKGSKWISLYDYANKKGIKKDEIIAIGDDNNDIEMIKNAGLGIGMRNGSDEVKSVADIITDKDNNEGGLGYILEKIFNI
ncbi:hydrolase-like protein, HAD superfamily type 3 [Gottschalkia purinilytica]|uniref:Hydrolase-like protein, HAD superfamily type 3 n=1 Tax=Gottschalkia purinilytica TaxID=1503 RepID=A0A0L0WFC2_GOTPU|nr:Cof-type HAD-IIB family hydrolase [Gottschalkia purinilytica]KNF10178.1 hydrolase-like protein, HAD superfamily type 3 [Gottschalkia purinilytica]